MASPKGEIKGGFNAPGKPVTPYTLTLARPGPDPAAQGEAFCATLARWLGMQGDIDKGNARLPEKLAPAGGKARVKLYCTEEMMARIERQFGGDILRADPPPVHARATAYPPKVDPWDVGKW